MTMENTTDIKLPASPPLPAPAGSESPGTTPPKAKEGWDHSEMVLVYYAADPETDRSAKWSIAYYHWNPPYETTPHWVDFNTSRGRPDYWWPLPALPNERGQARREQPKT